MPAGGSFAMAANGGAETIVPCEQPRDDCDRNAHCEHSRGYDHCECNAEFYGDGMTCDAPRAAARVSTGYQHTCAIIGSGKVRCWGSALAGALGNRNTSQDIGDNDPASDSPVADLSQPVTEVVAGDQFTCVSLPSGDVRCWGTGVDGQLGTGYAVEAVDPATADNVALGARAAALCAGGAHACALTLEGNVRCWGANEAGQLGYGTPPSDPPGTPDIAGDVQLGQAVVSVSAGRAATCAVLASGAIRCWGKAPGLDENVGDDETPLEAGVIDIGADVQSVAVGSTHSCALTSAGNVRCWGANDLGQLGYAIPDLTVAPAKVAELGDVPVGGDVKQVVVGDQLSCALLTSGAVRCWGYCGGYAYGNCLNIGDLETPADAGDAPIGGPVASLSATSLHVCAVMVSGGVRCFGEGKNGALGYGNLNAIGDDETPASAGDVPLF
jgi:alpha-tubulin suppressor-like RCC1 family protein